MPIYKIINPQIEGSFNHMIKATDPLNAALTAWKKISKHIINIVPSFIFTLQNTLDDSLTHHKVTEEKQNDTVEIIVKEIDLKIADDMIVPNKFNYMEQSINKSIMRWSYNGKIYGNHYEYDIKMI